MHTAAYLMLVEGRISPSPAMAAELLLPQQLLHNACCLLGICARGKFCLQREDQDSKLAAAARNTSRLLKTRSPTTFRYHLQARLHSFPGQIPPASTA